MLQCDQECGEPLGGAKVVPKGAGLPLELLQQARMLEVDIMQELRAVGGNKEHVLLVSQI